MKDVEMETKYNSTGEIAGRQTKTDSDPCYFINNYGHQIVNKAFNELTLRLTKDGKYVQKSDYCKPTNFV